jgi:GH35 family endo-1,4-beta-xylanase
VRKLIFLFVFLTGNALGSQPDRDILGRADERIQKYRAGRAVLRLVGSDGQPIVAGQQVKIEQTRHKFLFGCNIFKLNKCKTQADNAAYAQRFAELFNFATLPFYWWAYVPQQGKPLDARTEEILDWCRKNNIAVKGHPLAWNFGDPKWLPKDADKVMQLQFSRIGRCVQHFSGRLDMWDVVNEATHWDREECWKRSPLLSQAIGRTGMEQYVRLAFQAARKGNPKATLLINDYRTDSDYEELVLKELVDGRGRPLYDVIGIQSHQHGEAWPVEKIWEVCERFAKYGKPLHFTETTFLSGRRGWKLTEKDAKFDWVSTPEGERRQAEEVERFYTVLFSHPSVEAITWWDFTDQQSWQDAPAGFLRRDMSAKPAYFVLNGLIKGKWWTKSQTTVQADGEAGFRGFFGQYKVTVEIGGTRLIGTFKFDKDTKGTIMVFVR